MKEIEEKIKIKQLKALEYLNYEEENQASSSQKAWDARISSSKVRWVMIRGHFSSNLDKEWWICNQIIKAATLI